MIITCPECATRYDLEDDRFLPNGRSVRCTACGESWFVPAPEAIEALTPSDIAADEPSRRQSAPEREERHASKPGRFGVRMSHDDDDEGEDLDNDGMLPPRDEKGRFMSRKAREEAAAARKNGYGQHDRQSRDSNYNDAHFDDADFDDEEDDSLFDTPIAAATRKAKANAQRNEQHERDDETNRAGDEPPKGWRQGKQFFVEDVDEKDGDPRSFFARRKRRDEPKPERKDDRENAKDRETGLRFGASRKEARVDDEPIRDTRRAGPSHDSGYDSGEGYRDQHYRHENFRDEDDVIPGEATIVDADFEELAEEGEFGAGRHFGRRIREERRRATAVARMEDVRRFEPDLLDEEFFASLHVTPRELENAVRKARRRAEARDKNRMTPWRAFGWSAWVAAIAGAAYAVVTYRDEIVKVAPSAADAYAVIGIETEPFGLKIENVRHRLAMSTGGPMIEITGALRNASIEAADAPLLQAEALGPRGELLSRWTFTPSEPTIAGDGTVTFMTRNPAPEGVSEVALSFAPAQSAVSGLLPKPEK